MTPAIGDLLLAALGLRGDAVAIVAGGAVVAENPRAAALGDAVALAARLGEASALVATGDGLLLEVTAVAVGGAQVIVGRDVTERERLRRALARSDEILAIGAHELKGPLHVIGMICHLIETRAGRAEPIDRPTLDRLRRQVARLSRLLNELLDASRAQEGRMVLDLEDLELSELVREQAAAAAAARIADVRLSLPPQARLRGDAVRLAAVVFQLVDNAARFTPEGTAIRVTLDEDGGGWRLVVADQGPGLPGEEAAHLFERGPRADRSPLPEVTGEPPLAVPPRERATGQGLGLGLFVAAAIVRLHQGTIAYSQAPGGGATFTVRLPR